MPEQLNLYLVNYEADPIACDDVSWVGVVAATNYNQAKDISVGYMSRATVTLLGAAEPALQPGVLFEIGYISDASQRNLKLLSAAKRRTIG